MNIDTVQLIIVAVFIAISASFLGVFAILKRMALVGDALSHVALPGIALGILWKFDPLLGAVVFLVIATIGVWLLETRTQLSVETIVGVFFSASLALGALITPEPELAEALFGNITALKWQESLISVILSIIIVIILLAVHKKLALNMVSSDLANSVGIKNRQLEFIYLLIFALSVALGIHFVGALLMGSLVIIPAASAKNIAKSLNVFMVLSIIFGVFATISGILISQTYHYSPGPIFVLISTAIFIFSIIFKGLRK